MSEKPHGVTREMMDAAIEAMNFHGFDFRAPWECDMSDMEHGEFVALQCAIAAAVAVLLQQRGRE